MWLLTLQFVIFSFIFTNCIAKQTILDEVVKEVVPNGEKTKREAPDSVYKDFGEKSDIKKRLSERFRRALMYYLRVGEKIRKDPNNPKYRYLAEEALEKYLQTSHSDTLFVVSDIDSVLYQLTAAPITFIDFRASPTNCKVDRNGRPLSAKCHIVVADMYLSCHSETIEAHSDHRKNIDVSCKEISILPSKPSVLSHAINQQKIGGKTEQDPSKPKYETLAKQALLKYQLTSGDDIFYDDITVEKVFTQLVSGTLTFIDFIGSATSCKIDNNGQPLSDSCPKLIGTGVLACHAKIFEQRWKMKTDIDVSCKRRTFNAPLDNEKLGIVVIGNTQVMTPSQSSSKRPVITGGKMKQDPTKSEYKKLAQNAIVQYQHENGDDDEYIRVTVNKVFTQVVNGIITYIDFIGSYTNCKRDANGDPISDDCRIMIGSYLVCNAKIFETVGRTQDYTVHCARQIPGSASAMRPKFIAGGKMEQDPTKSEYKKLAQNAIVQYQHENGDDDEYIRVTVNKVFTQVVNGIITYIDFIGSYTNCKRDANGDPISDDCRVMFGSNLVCNAKIFETVGRKQDYTVHCVKHIPGNERFDKKNIKVLSYLKKTNNNLMGNITSEEDHNDPQYKKLAQEAFIKFENKIGNHRHYEISVKKVISQLVSGFNYLIDFVAIPTDCKIDKSPSSQFCVPIITYTYICHTKIYKPFHGKIEIIENDCKKGPINALPGGKKLQNPHDAKYKILAQKALAAILGADKYYEVEVIEVYTALFAGIRTYIDFVGYPTNCKTNFNGKPTSGNCHLMKGSSIISCHAEISQPFDKNVKDSYKGHCKLASEPSGKEKLQHEFLHFG